MNLSIQNVIHVAKREIHQTMGKKGFLLALIIPVVFLAGICSLVPLAKSLIEKSENLRTEPVKIGVLGANPTIMKSWREHLRDQKLPNGLPLFEFNPIHVMGISDEIMEKNAKQKVFQQEWDAYIVMDGDITKYGQCDFYTTRGFDLNFPRVLFRTLQSAVKNERLMGEGLDPERIERLNRGISWNEYEISPEIKASGKEGGKKRRAKFEDLIGPALICIMMMFFLTFGTSQMLLRGVVEEKTSRVIELLLSSLSPTEIYTGKILGFFIIGLTQFAFWVTSGVLILPFLDVSVTDYVPPIYFLNYSVFLITGYLFYATIFSAIGSIVTDESESQQFQVIFNIVNVIPMMMYFVFIAQPNWWVVRLISFIPLFSHSVMALRMVAAPIPWWEITLVALTSLSFAIIGIIFAARIFRIGILMTGKRPSLKEVWRWCFYREGEGIVEV